MVNELELNVYYKCKYLFCLDIAMETKALLRLQQMNRSPLNMTQTPSSTSSVNIAGLPQNHHQLKWISSKLNLLTIYTSTCLQPSHTSVTETMYNTISRSNRAFSGLRNCFQVLYVISAVLLK